MDEELQKLARDASPLGRLRHARALERLGASRDEVLDALLPGREDAAVRRELAAFPAWSTERASPGNTHFVDVAPVRSTPRVLWRRAGTLDPAREATLALQFLVAPHVVVATDRQGHAVVLDAVSGRELWAFEHGDDLRDSSVAIVEDALVVPDDACLHVRDVWTGEERSVHEVPGRLEVRDSLVLARDGPELVARELVAGQLVDRWRARIAPMDLTIAQLPRFLATPRFVFGREPNGFVALDRATGERAWSARCEVWCADERSCIASVASRGLELLDLSGSALDVGLERYGMAVAFSPAIIVVLDQPVDGQRAMLVERATGRVVVSRATRGGVELGGVGIARDVVYSYVRELLSSGPESLRAHAITGEVLWELPVANERGADDVFAVVPAHRRLYTYARDGAVTCYG